MIRFQTELAGYDVAGIIYDDGSVSLSCDALSYERYSQPARLEAALKAHDLSLRKQIANPEAWRPLRHSGPSQPLSELVTVTSVLPGGTEAWIKTSSGRREKAYISNLFPDQQLLETAMREEQSLGESIVRLWARIPRWVPEFPEGAEGAK